MDEAHSRSNVGKTKKFRAKAARKINALISVTMWRKQGKG